ncbi:hypothetical protein O181_056650 [Austropuccinia psidii MF-1]|uniref:Uncharacterized protein n=1 Tax=Austropuccinia psidii MF-1 TaxID=1389203 RepID=A0A9Q3ED27_9BASI|nr:hypothetical protein [Austropuccinia psidii MF-1]
MFPHPRLIFSLAFNPYAAAGPSSYASYAALTPPYASSHPPIMPLMLLTILTLSVPSQHASDTPDHPYACGVPSHHASDTAYHPYTCSDLLTCLQHRLPSLHLYSTRPTCLQCCLPSLCSQCPPKMPPAPPSNWPDPYTPAAPSR